MDQSAQDEIKRLKQMLHEKAGLIDQQSEVINSQNDALENLIATKNNQVRKIHELKLERDHQIKFRQRVWGHFVVRFLRLFRDEK
ncbi:hypothetical protein K8T06_00150 [bacterium]|nr:hypothetical protein [bacterium]